jgi:serine protease
VNDPLFVHQWALEQIEVPAAWARGFTGRGTTIAILDSGIDQSHPDLLPNMLPGFDMLAKVLKRADCPPGPEDDNGHGTHTAGTAAAAANNGIGVAGVAYDAKILPIKAGDESDIPLEAMTEGIRYAADQGADVVSVSLARGESPFIPGTQPAPLEPTVEAAVDYAWEKGTVVVGAAGNGSLPLCSYPGGGAHAICVTASDRLGKPTSYSNAGAEADGTVVVRAPGGGGAPYTVDGCTDNVVSTMWPRGDYESCWKPKGVRGYENLAGTSMSTPHVAGLAALLAGAGLTAPEIVARIRDTAALPFSIVDADAATEGLPTPAPPPPAPPPAQPGESPRPAPSAADRRCRQARATLKLREKALRRAKRRYRGKRTRANARLLKRHTAARRVAARDVRRRCS